MGKDDCDLIIYNCHFKLCEPWHDKVYNNNSLFMRYDAKIHDTLTTLSS